jgi:hypothetical protein
MWWGTCLQEGACVGSGGRGWRAERGWGLPRGAHLWGAWEGVLGVGSAFPSATRHGAHMGLLWQEWGGLRTRGLSWASGVQGGWRAGPWENGCPGRSTANFHAPFARPGRPGCGAAGCKVWARLVEVAVRSWGVVEVGGQSGVARHGGTPLFNRGRDFTGTTVGVLGRWPRVGLGRVGGAWGRCWGRWGRVGWGGKGWAGLDGAVWPGVCALHGAYLFVGVDLG